MKGSASRTAGPPIGCGEPGEWGMTPTSIDDLLDAISRSGLSDEVGELFLECIPEQNSNTGADPLLEEGPVYLRRITVEGFRGIGSPASLDLQPGTGLTIVVGANGSGKSSLAEGAERVVSGKIVRLEQAQSDAKVDWRNVHHNRATKAELSLIAEQATHGFTLGIMWEPDDSPAGGTTFVQRDGEKRQQWDPTNWNAQCSAHPPTLASDALERIVNGKQSELFDAIHQLLGLELCDQIDRSLLARDRELKGAQDTEKQAKTNAVEAAAASEIPELQDLHDQLTKRGSTPLSLLDRLAHLTTAGPSMAAVFPYCRLPKPPTDESVTDPLNDLDTAQSELRSLQAGAGQRSERLAELLDAALRYHQPGQPVTCPVCGEGTLDDHWRHRATDEISREREASSALTTARNQIDDALRRLRDLLPPVGDLTPVDAVPDSALLLAEVATTAEALTPDADASELLVRFETLRPLMDGCRRAADEAADDLAARRQPVDEAAARWRTAHEGAEGSREDRKRLKQARDWLKDYRQRLRDQRLASINDRALRTYARLRQTSSIGLGPLHLEGSSNRRRLELTCDVDGVETSARSVLSRGELHAVGLSLFIPRALHPSSPFGFLVIDDPVQALDRAKVGGLATVLAEIAAERQVIVFTHDERLPDAADRLGIDATVVRIDRSAGSKVTVEVEADPIKRALGEAESLALDTEIDPDLAARAVAGACREAVEAAAARSYRRRAQVDHVPIEQIDQELEKTTAFWDRVGLGLWGEADRAGRQRVERQHGAPIARLLGTLNSGGHGAPDGWTADRLQTETRRALPKLFGRSS